jgi:ABC-type glycerol-3-phosphate transport system substrate-binding protein
MRKRLILIGLIVAVLAVFAVPGVGLRAQESGGVTLTIAVSDFMRDIFNERLIKDYEASHPGIKVKLVGGNNEIPFATNGTDKYFEALEKLANSADLIYVDFSRLNSPLATQAGYFLNLAPLITSDSTLNTDDYVPSIWRNYQWDNGMWAIPMSASAYVLTYDVEAFDKAGLSYPNARWTIDDLANAARTLGQKDAEGKVTSPGLAVFPEATALLILSLLNDTLVDNSTIPNTPHIDKPSLEAILDVWVDLEQEGWIGSDFGNAPMSVAPAEFIMGQQGRKLAGSLLPGGKAGLEVQGFAISQGTQHPQEAYELAKYLSSQSALSMRFMATSALKNPPTQVPGGDNGIQFVGPEISPEAKQLIADAVANGLTLADFRYADFMLAAITKMKQDGLDAKSALQTAQLAAVTAQQAAIAQKEKLVIVVATPIPQQAANPGEITLNFGMTSFMMPFPNRDKWDQLLADFAANDPEVGQVNFNISPRSGGDDNDCYYLPYNGVADADLSKLLSLDPLLSADTSFDKNDLIGNIMSQVQRDNKTWAMPISIEPSILRYDSEAFKTANVPEPESGWTMDSFMDALRALKTDSQTDAPFVPRGIGGTGQYLLMLIAANGGLPLDYRTTPATLNFTDPATIEAIQQILDMAKQGYIKYEKMANPPFKAMMLIGIGEERRDPIFTDVLNAFAMNRGGEASNSGDSPYKLTTYPRGSKYSALAYSLSTAYISADAQNPEACYRLIKTLAGHPELFQAMPVRHSQINDPAVTAAQGADLAGLYAQLDTLLKDPNTVAFPSGFAGGGISRQALEYWLFKAFDDYVLNDADLTTGLTEAQSMAQAFQECIDATPINPSDREENFDAFKTCMEKVDPSLK